MFFKFKIPKKKQIIWRILKKHKFFYSVIVRTYLHKYNYDSLIRFFLSCSYSDLDRYNLNQIPPQISQYLKFKDIKEYESCNPHNVNQILDSFVLVHPKIVKLMIGHPILIKAFLVLRFKIHKKDELYNYFIKKIKKNFSIAKSACDNINSANLSNNNNASSQENLSLTKYQNNQNPEDVFAPYAHLWTVCDNCETSIYKQYAQKDKYICKHCAFHLPMESLDRIESLIDSGTWDSTDENMVSTNPYEILRKNIRIKDNVKYFEKVKNSKKYLFFLKKSKFLQDNEFDYFNFCQIKDIPYMDKVDSYQRETGLTDAVQTGIGQLDGIPVALAVMDFQFIGGSMGSVVGEKITRLIQYATRKSLPLIISCASGGARMQEGSFSLMQMAKISSTLLNFQLHENLFLVSLLTSPTTGGVTASFGMLGDIIIGEPDAYIAFAGKRVIEEVMKIEVPEGVQEAEYLFEKGSLDSIVPRNLLKGVLSELLTFHGFFPLNQNKNKI
uniref:acetyl-CoA carboxylase carboxyltransferase beta subunit n=1 Tax=Carex littledalei TaxID=544730 RepID=UPI0021CCC230|nr:acetyl-CoA carboxylase carboxyltransferase beta subunit [Carex littledalei]UWT58494.1 acetyl-CoA carboxylase carboxyltransferase beta subunit [Carex littledalei]